MSGSGHTQKTTSPPSTLPLAPATPATDSRHAPTVVATGVERLLTLEPLLRAAAALLVTALLALGLYFGRELLVPIALAGFFGFLLDPLVTRLKRWGVPRTAAALIVTLTAVACLAGMAAYMLSQMRALSADLPTYQDTIRAKLVDIRQQLKAPSDWDGALSTLRVVSKEIDEVAETRAPQRVVMAEPEVGPARTVALWMARIGGPAATAGIVLLFVILILIDRDGLRDRILRVMGRGDLHMATDALSEAGTRIGRYLRMQLIVNATYGVPLGVGLFLIGVPGAFLWGGLAIILRFIPYLGPVLCGLFPLVLAFAVDPGWSMVMWTVALIVGLELISNNVIEPWLYGASTGLSPLSIIVAAMFWTTMWGPVGLILSTPLTVCLLVMGRHLPGLGFLETLLGSAPVLDAPNRLYQRLLAGNTVDATELATDAIDEADDRIAQGSGSAVVEFYDTVAIPALRLASMNHSAAATAQHRLQFTTGMAEVLQEIQEDYPPEPADAGSGVRIHCLGARWEIDALSAHMLRHALLLHGLNARVASGTGGRVTNTGQDELAPGDVVCICLFHPEPQALVRLIARRIRRLQRDVRVIALPWGLAAQSNPAVEPTLASDEWAGSIREVVRRLVPKQVGEAVAAAAVTPAVASTRAPRGRHPLDIDAELRERHHELVRQVADAFDVAHAQVSWSESDTLAVSGSTLLAAEGDDIARIPEAETACRLVLETGQPVVIEDVQRDPRVAELPALQRNRIRFYAGVPLIEPGVGVVGSLCILDTQPGALDDQELALLRGMADKLISSIQGRHPERTSSTT